MFVKLLNILYTIGQPEKMCVMPLQSGVEDGRVSHSYNYFGTLPGLQ